MNMMKIFLLFMSFLVNGLQADDDAMANKHVIDTEFLKIFSTVGGAGMGIGILVDELAACISDRGYFYIGLETFPSMNPSQVYGKNNSGLAIVTSLSKTWKESLVAAMMIASSARFGNLPKLSLSDTKKIIAVWSAAIFIGSLVTGVTSYCRTLFDPVTEDEAMLVDPKTGQKIPRGGLEGVKDYVEGTSRCFGIKSAHNSLSPLLLVASALCASWVIYKRYQLHKQELLKPQPSL